MKEKQKNSPEWTALQQPADDALVTTLSETVPGLTEAQRKRILETCAKRARRTDAFAETDWVDVSEEPADHNPAPKASGLWMRAACLLTVLALGAGLYAIGREGRNLQPTLSSEGESATVQTALGSTPDSQTSSTQTTALDAQNSDPQTPSVAPATEADEWAFPEVSVICSRTNNGTGAVCLDMEFSLSEDAFINFDADATTMPLTRSLTNRFRFRGRILNDAEEYMMRGYFLEYCREAYTTEEPMAMVLMEDMEGADAAVRDFSSLTQNEFASLSQTMSRETLDVMEISVFPLHWQSDLPSTQEGIMADLAPGTYSLQLELAADIGADVEQPIWRTKTISLPFTVPDWPKISWRAENVQCDGSTLNLDLCNLGEEQMTFGLDYTVYSTVGGKPYSPETVPSLARLIPARETGKLTYSLEQDLGTALPSGQYILLLKINGEIVQVPFTVKNPNAPEEKGLVWQFARFNGRLFYCKYENTSDQELRCTGGLQLSRLNPETMEYESVPFYGWYGRTPENEKEAFSFPPMFPKDNRTDLSDGNGTVLPDGCYQLMILCDTQTYSFFFQWENHNVLSVQG